MCLHPKTEMLNNNISLHAVSIKICFASQGICAHETKLLPPPLHIGGNPLNFLYSEFVAISKNQFALWWECEVVNGPLHRLSLKIS